MNKLIWVFAAFLAGTFLPIQAGLNAKLGKAGSSPIHASMISFFIGAIAVASYIIITKQTVSWAGIKTAPAYAWIGGFLGAFYVTIVILAFPKLGPALTFGLVVTGQMLISALFEHFNILVAQQHPITIWRLFGFLLVIVGVIIIRKF
ncbi:MAG: DMT family transporter [Bacteroidota bacterium]